MTLRNLNKALSTILQNILAASKCETLCNISQRQFHVATPFNGKMKFILQGIDLNKYTMRPLPYPKTGGRGHDGRIWTHGIGGGHKQRFRMIDFKRTAPADGPPVVERITSVRYDPCRTADIAIVAGGEKRRYIVASQNMKAGDLIKTSGKVTRIAVKAEEGDAYPVGSLPLGTMVHCVEMYPGEGGKIARAAGTCAQLVRKVGDRCFLKMPSKREINVSNECMATVGRVSNINHDKEHIGSAGRARWFGIRPQSGLWHRKTGYNGRKIRPIKPAKVYTEKKKASPLVYKYTF